MIQIVRDGKGREVAAVVPWWMYLRVKDQLHPPGVGPILNEGDSHSGYGLRQIRETLGLSQTQVAHRVGVTQSYVCQLETRVRLSPEVWDKFMEVLGVGRL